MSGVQNLLEVFNKLEPFLSENECTQVTNAVREIKLQANQLEMLLLFQGKSDQDFTPDYERAETPRQEAALFVCYIKSLHLKGTLNLEHFQTMEEMEAGLKEIGEWDLLLSYKAALAN